MLTRRELDVMAVIWAQAGRICPGPCSYSACSRASDELVRAALDSAFAHSVGTSKPSQIDR